MEQSEEFGSRAEAPSIFFLLFFFSYNFSIGSLSIDKHDQGTHQPELAFIAKVRPTAVSAAW